MEENPKPAMAVAKVEARHGPAVVAIEMAKSLNPAGVGNRNPAVLPEHNHHEAGMPPTPVGEAEFMRRQ